MPKMLLSIKPFYASLIVAGDKTVEFRKFHCKKGIDTILIYATSPIRKIIGEVALLNIIEGDLEEIWLLTKDSSGLSKKEYTKYYGDRKLAVAYLLGQVTVYDEPLDLKDVGLNYIPRSFAYIE